jgi:hypothetical protein
VSDENHKARAFLAAYKITCNVTAAALAASIERDMHYRWLAGKKGYAAAFERAKEEAAQTLEDEAVRRAHEGVLEPKFWKGKPVGAVRIYSDALLMFLLKSMRPDKYRDNWKGELTVPGGLAITVEEKKLQHLTDDELATLIAIAGKFATAERDAGRTIEASKE